MKIAMLGTKGIPAKWGGIEKYIEEISVRLAAMGHEVTVFGSKWYCRDYHHRVYKSVNVVQLPSMHMQATDALSNGALATLFSMGHRFDVANFHGYASYFYLPFFKMMNIKTVVTPHGVESGWDNPKYGSVGRTILKKAFALGIRNADAVVTVAMHLKQNIEDNFGVGAEVIYSGLDAGQKMGNSIIKKKYGLNGGDYVFFIGRIDPIKRVHWLTELSQRLPAEVKMVVSGGAQDKATEKYLKQLKVACLKNEGIIFTGPVAGEEKVQLLNNCICVLVPSKYEGLPITLLEAASYGRSCIASSIPAHDEVIENGVNGFLFPNGDKNAFIDMTLNLLNNDPGLMGQAGRQAKEMAKQKFDWDKTSLMYERLFRRLVDV